MTIYPQDRTFKEDYYTSEKVPTTSLGLDDVEKIQALYPDYQIELREGKIIVMCPSDIFSSQVGVEFSTLLNMWVHQHNLGRVLDASAGFRMPNGDLLSPDVSFISREQLKQSPRSYASVVPQLIIEIKSSRDRVRELEEKIALFLQQGVQVGILIDPDTRTVRVYRSAELSKHTDSPEPIPALTTLEDGDTLTIPDLFPGLEIPITNLWPLIYE